jgi:hypothetical protein
MMNGVNGAAVWIWKRINDSKLPGIKFLGFNPYTGEFFAQCLCNGGPGEVGI